MIIGSIVVISIILIDQITKYYAQKRLGRRQFQKGPFTFKIIYNKGAFRGILKERPVILIFIQIVSIIFVSVLWIIYGLFKKERAITLALSMIMGGAIGNLIDRCNIGKVTDFFAIRWTKNLFYNLADFFIFLGGVWILFIEIKGYITKS